MKLITVITKIIIAFFAVQMAFSQTENVGIGTTAPDNSALLHLDVSAMATKRGLLIPKVTSAQRTAISSPANGLLIYDTDDNRFYYNTGTPATPNWVAFVATNSTFPFNLLSSGTNTTAAMLVGTGASLAPTGTGFIQANRFVGVASATDAVDLATSEVSGILPIANGGTGLSTTPTNGQLLIGNGTGYTLNTLSAGTGISITNGSGTITLSADAANISHNSLNNLQLAQSGVTYGHIDDQAQTIAGAKTFSSNVTAPTFTSTVNTGTAPFTVNSTTLVNNLNADLLDGLNSTDFLQTTSTGNLTTTTTGVTITGGTNAVIGSGTTINIATASGTTTGLLTSTDWTTFNNKENALTFTAPLTRTLNTISITQASGTNDGYLSAADWTTFNNKQNAITQGNLTTTTTGVTITGGTNAVIGSGTTINIATADGTTTGLLTSTDWTTFNNKLGSGSTAGGDLSGTYPNPTVDGLQGYAVSNTAPSNGQVLKWNGTAWTPSTDETTSLDAGNGIDISGTTISVNFAGSGTANTASRSDHNHDGTYEYPLTFSSPLSRTGNTISIPQANTSTNGYLSSTDWETFNNKLSSSLTDGYIFVGNSSDVATGVALTGDATITNTGVLTVTAIQNRTISTTAPTNGQILTWNNTLSQWEPQSVGSATGWSLSGNTLSGTEILGSTNNQPLSIVTNNAERLRIAAGGNIGLGYDDPKVILHQDQGNATATYHKFTAGTTTGQTATDGFDLGIDASGNAILNQRENLNLQISTNNTERMRILNNGKVLIGTTTAPNDSVLVRINGDVLIDQDLIVEGNIDPEAIIFKQRTQPPGTATEGMVYYNSTEKKLKVHDGNGFQDISGEPVVVRAYLGNNLTLNNNTSWFSLDLDSETYDNTNSYSSSTFTAPVNGYYKIDIDLLCAGISSGANTFEIRFEVNTNPVFIGNNGIASNTSVQYSIKNNNIIYLNQNDQLKFSIKKNSSSNLIIQSGSDKSFVTIHLIK